MGRFKQKQSKETPAISTASLPDIIFMLLIFFMISTKLRDSNVYVANIKPQATEIQKLKKKSAVSNVYVGAPMKKMQSKLGTEPRIQLNDAFSEVKDIKEFVQKELEGMSEIDKPFHTVSLKVDKKVTMGIVSDIKQELRQVGAFKINYSTLRKAPKAKD